MFRIGTVVFLLLTLVYCFTTEEVEVFQLQQELVEKYGDEIDLYKFLKLPKSRGSNSKEIIKNLRKLSKKYHPDKNPKYKKLYERLSKATQILSNDYRRKTYDYYLKNGFPDYNFSRGGFIFKRVQPKTWFLLMFLYIVASGVHYALLRLQNTSNKRRIDGFIQQCKEQDDSRGLGEKRLMFKQHEGDEPKEIIVRYGDVYLVEEDGNESLISSDTITDPSVFDCMFFRIPVGIWNLTLGRFLPKKVQPTKNEPQLEQNKQAEDKKSKNQAAKGKGGQKKMTLPNGKVIHSRKKD